MSQLVQDFDLFDEVLDGFFGELAFAEALDRNLGAFPDTSKDVSIPTACQEVSPQIKLQLAEWDELVEAIRLESLKNVRNFIFFAILAAGKGLLKDEVLSLWDWRGTAIVRIIQVKHGLRLLIVFNRREVKELPRLLLLFPRLVQIKALKSRLVELCILMVTMRVEMDPESFQHSHLPNKLPSET